MPMMPARFLAALEADRAAQAVDPKLLTDVEKDAKILALQQRVEMLESVCLFAFHQLQAIERATLDAGANDRTYRRLILAQCQARWEWATPVTSTIITDPETGAESFMRRSL